jgi:hypothetical protein
MDSLQETINELPPELKSEVEDFARFLLTRHKPPSKQAPHFKWAGALKSMKTDYTSVDLQHKILEIRANKK